LAVRRRAGLCAARVERERRTPSVRFQVPTRTPHGGPNEPAKTVIISTYVVEKDKPLASPA
jgi:hypothetical protein